MARPAWRALLGVVLGCVARLWLATLRVRVLADPSLDGASGRPWVLAFWHGTQWPLLAWRRRRPTVALVSWSRDGAVQARALALQGLLVARGSSSRGAASGLAAVIRAMKAGADAAFAVDGPRGPRGRVKGGAVAAARASGGVVVPMSGVVCRGVVLQSTWDRFALAWPFTRVEVRLGAPIDPAVAREPLRDLEEALTRLNRAPPPADPRRTDGQGDPRRVERGAVTQPR